MIRAFMLSPKFAALSRSTRTNYGYLLSRAERPEALGAISVNVIRPAHVQAFLDGLADKPATQLNAQTVLKSLERWAIVRDMLPYPITLGTEAPGGDGAHEPWPEELVALAEREAAPRLRRIITLMSNTGQRGSDIVRMRFTDIEDYEGRPGLNVTQQKTGHKIWVPMTQELQNAVATWQRRPGFICVKDDGQPFTRKQLSDQWVRERAGNPALAPIKALGLVLHGLRATAVVRLRRAGATTGQIGSMVGMSEPMVNRYCRRSVQKDNALAAVHYLDRTGTERRGSKASDKGS